MNKQSKILFFGPFPEPYTGQSISFKQVFENFNSDKILFNTTNFKKNKIINSLYCLFFLPIVFVFYKFDKIYFTCTRSKFGFIKDFQLLLFAKIFNKKVVNHLHGADFIDFYKNSGFLKKLIRWSYNHINTNIVLLPSMKDQFNEFSSSKIEVVANCYSSDFKDYKVDFSLKKKQLVFLSNLIYSKGVFVFLEAIKELLDKDKDLIIKIAGLPMGDELMSTKNVSIKFKEISEELKLLYPKRFLYLGVVQGKDKEDLLKESSIFVLPTFYKTEAFPLTIIEAMYFGNAIITTDHNYLKDVIDLKNGALIKTKSFNDIVDNVTILFQDKKRLQKIQGFNHKEAMLKYNPNTFDMKVGEIINNL
ncbi:glycosyltransferase family 4 protein [Polaribacter sp. NJDZ03]|uniref:glycosyltransferase family 4 protein n=1 Tax=Polaribacter sp. NJDZ03 TaxID=2855841 RepID=UPI001C4A2784|nr:glycosyltransferase family 4 protein [Polaribacter sp. NJDZ03]